MSNSKRRAKGHHGQKVHQNGASQRYPLSAAAWAQMLGKTCVGFTCPDLALLLVAAAPTGLHVRGLKHNRSERSALHNYCKY